VLATSAASFWLLRSSYAGVSDDAVVEAGVTAHAAYLRSVGAAVARIVAIEIASLGLLSVGLLALLPARDRRPLGSDGPGALLPRFVALALLVHLAWFGAEARRHPGLVLPLLTLNPIVPVWVALSRLLWPALLAGS